MKLPFEENHSVASGAPVIAVGQSTVSPSQTRWWGNEPLALSVVAALGAGLFCVSIATITRNNPLPSGDLIPITGDRASSAPTPTPTLTASNERKKS